MTHYMSVSEIATHLNTSVNTINSRIAAGWFPPPDAIIGTRYKGWLQSTIDEYHGEPSKNRVSIDVNAMIILVNEMRTAAERVDAYRATSVARKLLRDGTSTVFERNPSYEICKTATTIEGFIRSTIRSEYYSYAFALPGIGADAPTEAFDPIQLEIKGALGDYLSITNEFCSAPVMVPDRECSPDTAAHELYAAADTVDDIARRIKRSSAGLLSKSSSASLTRQAAEIRLFANRLVDMEPVSAASEPSLEWKSITDFPGADQLRG